MDSLHVSVFTFIVYAQDNNINNNNRIMKLTIKNVALGLALCGLASCANEAPWGGSRGKGGIDLQLTADADVKDALPSVRAGAPELVAPDVADFSIEMRNLDTDQVQTWRTLEEFNAHNQEQGFDVGSYTLTAFYGNENECGFDKPYFKGVADVNVLEGREASVDVTAQLANVMLSVDYTDSFRKYFSDYSVTAHTNGHANVTFGKNETRAGFLTKGSVTLQVALTNPSGKSITLTPAEFPAVARHHYHVTFDVNADPIGGTSLNITFDDSVMKENVTFSLADELYNAEAPVVGSEGFESGQTVEALSGNTSAKPLKFETICKGGIKSAVLKIAQISGDIPFTPSFGTEIDLIQTDESTQHALEQHGIKAPGLFKNPDQMAIVDVTELPKYLPEGTFEITLTVTDNLDRNNETPVVLNLATLPISLDVLGGSADYQYYYSTAQSPTPTVDATVTVTYNGLNPMECITFKNKCQNGGYKDCENVEVKESTETRGFPEKTYIFSIKVCDTENSPLPMEMYFNKEKRADFTLDIIEPVYKLTADPFATYARFKVTTEKSEELANVVKGLYIYKDGSLINNVLRDTDNGILTIEGLAPDTDYTIGYSLTTPTAGLPESNILKIHTESEEQIPNGDFSEVHRTIDLNMQVGGVYRCGAIDYTNWSKVIVDEPVSWSSVNPKTFYQGAKTINSWFTVVSTYVSNGQVIIRSVGYDHNGALPSKTGEFLSSTHYNTNTPTISAKAAGELFIGSYSYDGKDNRVEGISFGSRPSSLSFDCSYSPYQSDRAVANVEVLDVAGKVIASGSRNISSSPMHTEYISLEGYPFGSKAAAIRILFKSSKDDFSVEVPNPNVDDWSGALPVTPYHHNLGDNNYHTFAAGSVLAIDNVKLNY